MLGSNTYLRSFFMLSGRRKGDVDGGGAGGNGGGGYFSSPSYLKLSAGRRVLLWSLRKDDLDASSEKMAVSVSEAAGGWSWSRAQWRRKVGGRYLRNT